MNSNILGDRIKGMMTIKKIKRKDMAEKLELSYNTLTKKLNGQREFSYSEIVKIKDILNMNAELYANILFNSDFMLEKDEKIA